MYVFKSSFLRAKDSRDGYQNINITNTLMSSLLEDFVDGYMTLTHTQIRGTFYLTIDALRQAQVPMVTTMTFNQWVTHIHDKELPISKVAPKYKQGKVIYSDAFRADFKVDRVGRYMSVDANISNADKVDLLLRKNIPNRNDLYTKVVATVNGFAHRAFSHEDGIALDGAGTTFNNTGVNTCGILSFFDACSVRQYRIEESMIAPTSSTIPLHHELLINLGQPLHNKSVILSIGGYLFVNKGIGEVINPEAGIIMVKLIKLDLIKMMLNSVGKIDLDSLGIFAINKSVNYNKVRVEDIKSDLCVKKYMTLPQSFVIVADTECIQTDYRDLSVTGLPGVYESSEEPIYPIVNSHGIVSEYWKTSNENGWSVRLSGDITKRRMYQSNLDVNIETINAISPTYKWYHDDPKYLEITVTSKI